MPASAPKKGYRFRFELSVAGLFGVAAVFFCILLWMFLLGIWAGQALRPPENSHSIPAPAEVSGRPQKNSDHGSGRPQEPGFPEASVNSQVAVGEPDYAESTFFSLQVGAYSEAPRAEKTLAHWLERGHEAFLLPPQEGGDPLFRVCVGKFESLADANREAGRLEEIEGIRAFITLIASAGGS